MPKQRITKETVVNAAFEIARNSGMEQVMVKNIADKIGCSVQPIYSYCKNMEGLQRKHDALCSLPQRPGWKCHGILGRCGRNAAGTGAWAPASDPV